MHELWSLPARADVAVWKSDRPLPKATWWCDAAKKRSCQGPAYTRSWDLEIMDFFQWVFLSAVLSNQLVITVPLEQKNLSLWKMYLSMQLPHLADRDLTARLTFHKSPWWACSSTVFPPCLYHEMSDCWKTYQILTRFGKYLSLLLLKRNPPLNSPCCGQRIPAVTKHKKERGKTLIERG